MPSEPGARLTRCIAWTGGVAALPPELAGVLRAKGIAVTLAPDPYAALAQVCVACNESPEGSGGVVLLLVEPEGRIGVGPLAEAAERFAIRAVVWVFEADAPQRLRALTRAEADRWSGAESAPARFNGSPRNPPALRLTESSADNGHAPANGSGAGPVIRSGEPSDVENGIRVALSGDELSMLLGIEPRRGRPLEGR